MQNISNSICVVRISSLGDVLLASALLRQLRKRFPASRIDVVVSARFADALRYNPRITSVIALDATAGIRGILSAKQAARDANHSDSAFKYDILIDLQRNIRSAIFRRGAYRSVSKVKKYRLQKMMLVKFKRGLSGEIVPVPLRYTEAASKFGVTDDGGGLEFWLPDESESGIYAPERRKLRSLSEIMRDRAPRIAIAPGARHFTKRWPPERFAELAIILRREYAAEIILLGGHEDADLCAKISAAIPFHVKDLSGASLFDSARALDSSDFVFVNDSAAMHLAASRRAPLVAIFGSTVKELGFAPFRSPHIITEVALNCRPCSHIGLEKCPKGHFKCMLDISARKTAALLESFPQI